MFISSSLVGHIYPMCDDKFLFFSSSLFHFSFMFGMLSYNPNKFCCDFFNQNSWWLFFISFLMLSVISLLCVSFEQMLNVSKSSFPGWIYVGCLWFNTKFKYLLVGDFSMKCLLIKMLLAMCTSVLLRPLPPLSHLV